MKIESLFGVRGKIALVTGGSSGIGEMIARAYVENGARVYISSRKADVCNRIADELSQRGECIAIPADLSRMEEIQRLATEIGQREGRLDILVNNAGAAWAADMAVFPESGWDRIVDLNMKSVFFLTQQLLKVLEAAGSPDDYARVINIGSVEGMHVPTFESYSYAASKAGVMHLTRLMAKFLAPRHIAVNAIAPGLFPSRMSNNLAPDAREEARLATPMQRLGKPEDMAGVALYLASKASNFLCGAVIPLDGGSATTL